tara:strand:- start:544 stop:756 length:213 start_codon:yes stop_codon:yes gene_type:complete
MEQMSLIDGAFFLSVWKPPGGNDAGFRKKHQKAKARMASERRVKFGLNSKCPSSKKCGGIIFLRLKEGME